jgi:DNA-binding beta-propeller fold protein YncE
MGNRSPIGLDRLLRASRARLLPGSAAVVAAFFLGLAGCSSPPQQPPPAPVFYPPLPERPRIQFLCVLSSPADVVPKPSSFAQFVLGPEAQSQAGQINRPYGAAWRDGKLYVCDSGAKRCAVFDFAGHAFRTFGDQGPHRLALPINISLGAQGEKYVADTGLGAVLVFDSADQPVRSIALPEGMKPCDALWYDGALYVADLKSDAILVFDPESGRLLRRIGKGGDQPGEFHQPTNLAFGPDGSLYVSDTLNARVQKLDRQGRVLQVIGALGEAVGEMVRPRGIAVDRDGRLYVADAATDSVQIFDSTGQLLLMLGGPGAGPGDLSLPAKVALSYDGVQYFASCAAPEFDVECLIFVTSQLGPAKVSVYGLGTYRGRVPTETQDTKSESKTVQGPAQ